MFEADFSRTQRRARVDDGGAARGDFARDSLEWARSHGHDTLVWHFAAKDSLQRLARTGPLAATASRLHRAGRHTVAGVSLVLATKRTRSGDFDAPLAAWWPNDEQLLELDSTHRPLLDALVRHPSRAPIWLTAFEIDVGAPVGVQDCAGLIGAPDVAPIVVPPGLQETMSSHSRSMTLSTNGVHDSLAGSLVAALRRIVRSGAATPEAVAVAALKAGWWPDKVPDFLKKL